MHRHRIRGLGAGLLSLALGLVTLAPIGAQDRTGLVPKGAPPGLFLLYTGDVIGFLDPCG